MKDSPSPKVSIIIPVYNGSNFLSEAIDSALAQTYKNIEIIVINDGSNDNDATEKIAKSYGNKIKYYHKENGGVATALNLGIEKMTGDYFSWLSHDDLYDPYKIEKQIEFLSKIKDKKVILYSDYELINTKGKLIERRIQDHEMLEKVPIYSLLRGIVNGITMLIPKEVFKTHGKFDASLRCTQDYDMWYRIFWDYKFIHVPQILSMTRVHPNQDTVSNPKTIIEGDDLWIRMISNLPDSEKIKAEGSLFKFYLEMVKFIKYTPYTRAADFCRNELKNSIINNGPDINDVDDKTKAIEIFNTLISENQRVTAAYYAKSVINSIYKRHGYDPATELTKKILIGDTEYIKDYEIRELLISDFDKKKNKRRIMFCSGHWLTGCRFYSSSFVKIMIFI